VRTINNEIPATFLMILLNYNNNNTARTTFMVGIPWNPTADRPFRGKQQRTDRSVDNNSSETAEEDITTKHRGTNFFSFVGK